MAKMITAAAVWFWLQLLVVQVLAQDGSLGSCLLQHGISNVTTASSNAAAFSALLLSSMQNLRFSEAGVAKPQALIFPSSASEVQQALLCCNVHGVAVKVRGGGHSYEGLSSRSGGAGGFVVLDLANMHAVTVDVEARTAWVEGGATIGDVYYAVSQASDALGFPAGVCPTMGVGGHISGGGYGFLSRKYGTAADNVVDADLVTPQGQLLRGRSAIGEDVFWALRGGGGGSWGVVVAWRLRLVAVPTAVTSFRLGKTGKQLIVDLAYKWQSVAPYAPEELFHAVYVQGYTPSATASDVSASFYGQFLGTLPQTLALFARIFPELGLAASDCKEGRWVDGVVNIAAIPSRASLVSRANRNKGYYKGKSDYVQAPLSRQALAGALDKLEANPNKGYMIFEPYGGVMDRIGPSAIAFPHRKGNLYNIQYQAVWPSLLSASEEASLIDWLRGLYAYMQPFVSQAPRAAYVNYIDLDLGVAPAYPQALASWGPEYFLLNFPRLSQIKARLDPLNLFSGPQSIPPYP